MVSAVSNNAALSSVLSAEPPTSEKNSYFIIREKNILDFLEELIFCSFQSSQIK